MSIKPIYLEPDEEIISVIDKVSSITDRRIALVVPKNSGLFQSVINLKLLAKEAKKQDKKIAVITVNKVGQRLATDVGLEAYSSLAGISDVKNPIAIDEPAATPEVEEPDTEVVDGVKVNRYVPPKVGKEEPLPVKDDKEPVVDSSATPNLTKASDTTKVSLPDPTADFTTENIATHIAEENPSVIKFTPIEPPVVAEDSDSSEDDRPLPPIVSRSGNGLNLPTPRIPWRPIIIALVLLVVVFGACFIFLPKATVTITFPAQAINKTEPLVVTVSGKNTGLTVTGSQITSDKTLTKAINSTGTKDLGSNSTGTLTFYNKANSSPVTLAAGTVLTASSQNFILDKAVTIPGASVSNGTIVAGQATGSVTSSSVGDSSNVSNATFSIAKQNSSVYASGTTSGGVTKTVKVLAQADIDAGAADLKAQATSQTKDDLKTQVADKTLLEGATWQIKEVKTVDRNVGDQVDTANLTYELQMGALIFDNNATLNAIKGDISSSLKSDQTLVVQDPSTDVVYAFTSFNDAKTDMTVTAIVKAYAISNVDQQTIVKAIEGKSVSASTSKIKDSYGATAVDISVKPNWLPARLPIFSKSISVKYNFTQAQQ